jgi:glycosyltransferase involved in cell wall biosynthesis
MNFPTFSIIIPTYNRENSIANCLLSVLNQTFTNFEVLVIDNKSTDNTILEITKISDERIKLFVNDRNYERCYSRNKGIEQAIGDYITFLDSDDLFLPNHLQNWYDFLAKNKQENTFFISNKEICIKNEKRIIPPFIDYNDKKNLLKSPVIPGQTCIPTKIVKKFKFETDYLIFEDTALWLQLAMNYEISTVPFNSYSYSVNEDNSVNVKKNNFGERRILSIENFIRQNPKIVRLFGKRLFKIERSKSFFAIAKFYMANQNRNQALFYLLKSMTSSPTLFQFKHKSLLILSLILNKEIKEYGFKIHYYLKD